MLLCHHHFLWYHLSLVNVQVLVCEWVINFIKCQQLVSDTLCLTHHTFERVLGLISRVQELTVLQLLTEPLQGVERLIQVHWHGHLGQILSDVVPQDVPQTDAALWTGSREHAAPPCQSQNTTDCKTQDRDNRDFCFLFLSTRGRPHLVPSNIPVSRNWARMTFIYTLSKWESTLHWFYLHTITY